MAKPAPYQPPGEVFEAWYLYLRAVHRRRPTLPELWRESNLTPDQCRYWRRKYEGLLRGLERAPQNEQTGKSP